MECFYQQESGWGQSWLCTSQLTKGLIFLWLLFFSKLLSRLLFCTATPAASCHAQAATAHTLAGPSMLAKSFKKFFNGRRKSSVKKRQWVRKHSSIHKHCQQAKGQSNQIQMHTCGWALHPLCVTSCQCQHSLQTQPEAEVPILKHNEEPFHTYTLTCVNTLHTVKSWLFLLPLCVYVISFLHKPGVDTCWPPLTNLQTDHIHDRPAERCLLDTLNVVGARPAGEFVMASLSDKYRGALLSSNDGGGFSYLSLILNQTTEGERSPRIYHISCVIGRLWTMD